MARGCAQPAGALATQAQACPAGCFSAHRRTEPEQLLLGRDSFTLAGWGGGSGPAALRVSLSCHSTAHEASIVGLSHDPWSTSLTPPQFSILILLKPLLLGRFVCCCVPCRVSYIASGLLLPGLPRTWMDHAVCPSIHLWVSLPLGLHKPSYPYAPI